MLLILFIFRRRGCLLSESSAVICPSNLLMEDILSIIVSVMVYGGDSADMYVNYLFCWIIRDLSVGCCMIWRYAPSVEKSALYYILFFHTAANSSVRIQLRYLSK